MPPQSQGDGEIPGKLPGISIRPVIFLAFSPHDILDDRLIEVPFCSMSLIFVPGTYPTEQYVSWRLCACRI